MDHRTACVLQQSSFHLKPKTLNPTPCHPFCTPKKQAQNAFYTQMLHLPMNSNIKNYV